MAPNGSTSRKTPAASTRANSGDNETIALGNLFDDLNDTLLPKLKKDVKDNLPVVKKPGYWDPEVVNDEDMKMNPDRAAGRVKKIPSSLVRAFATGRPMVDQPSILKCNHCKRPVLESTMPRHIESCLNKRQEKQRKKKEAKEARDAAARKEKGQDSDEEDILDSKSINKSGAGKKRKAIDEGDDAGPNKKKKEG
ncbi:hypothetical protein AMS68_006343 [Peltaster fructicola]|uniref:SAGA-associated factor 11 n=1 Tax=Peltaster fructicola TaxID=286661 RepID=A0A6H0Y1L0_9PEZI|nr:hypothetical protein AMS68_006343 [Peltaster fructicola]